MEEKDSAAKAHADHNKAKQKTDDTMAVIFAVAFVIVAAYSIYYFI